MKATKALRAGTAIALPFFKTSALKMWVGGQHHAPAALSPGKTRFPLYRRLGGPQGRSAEILASQRDRPARSESLYRLSYPGRQSGFSSS